MAVDFLPTIVSLLNSYSATNALGWTATAQANPRRAEWNNVPCVVVSPSAKNDVVYMAFGKVRPVSSFDCFWVQSNKLDNLSTYITDSDAFALAVLRTFMPPPPAMYSAGAYDVRVSPKYDFDRGAFPSGYLVACAEVNVFWIDNR